MIFRLKGKTCFNCTYFRKLKPSESKSKSTGTCKPWGDSNSSELICSHFHKKEPTLDDILFDGEALSD